MAFFRYILSISLFCVVASSTLAQQSLVEDITYSKGTFFGGSRNDSYLLHVAVDKQGFVYGTGLCTDIPATAGAYRTSNAGRYDVMVFKLDPTMTQLIWATYIGGSNLEAGGSIAVNDNGEVFVTGYTMSANFPVTVPSDAARLADSVPNIFSLKLSANGSTLLYSRILGRTSTITQQTANASKGSHIALLPDNSVYVFSHTSVASFATTANAFQSVKSGSDDCTISKLDASGAIVYSTYYGGSGSDRAGDVCYANGKVYCVGTTGSAALALRSGKVPDASDAFVLVVDDGATPTLRKTFVFGGSGTDTGTSLCYDTTANRVCVVGRTNNASFPRTAMLLSGNTTGGFLVAVDSSLSQLRFSSIISASSTPTSVAARSNSTLYVAGYTNGAIPITSNALQQTLRGSMDGMLIAVDSTGQQVRYGSFIGGTNQDYSAAKVLLYQKDCVLRVIFGITTHSANFPSSTDSYQPLKRNGSDDQAALALFSTLVGAEWTSSLQPCSRTATFGINIPCPANYVRWNFGDGTSQVGVMSVSHTYQRTGTYTVTAALVYPEPDTVVFTRTITISSNNNFVDAGTAQVICKSPGSVQLRSTGAVTYRWYPSATLNDSTIANPIASPLVTTKYYVRGVDANGCESIDSVVVYVQRLVAGLQKDTTICEGGSALLKASGGTVIAWVPNTGLKYIDAQTVIASPKQTTTYTVLVADTYCTDSAKVTITVLPRPKIQMPPSPTVCAGSTVQLHAAYNLPSRDTVGVRYMWSSTGVIAQPNSAMPVVTPNVTTWYVLQAQYANGCIIRDSVRVVVQKSLDVQLPPDTNVCRGTSVTLQATGATEYEWSPALDLSATSGASVVCSPTDQRTYRVIGRSGLCADTSFIHVGVREMPSVVAVGATTVCQGALVTLSVAQPEANVRYEWFPSALVQSTQNDKAIVKPMQSTTFTVVATSQFGCTSSDSVKIGIDNSLLVSTKKPNAVCPGEYITLELATAVDSNSTVEWLPAGGEINRITYTYTVQAQSAATYTAIVRRGACVGTDSCVVRVKPLPTFSFVHDSAVCAGEPFTIQLQSSEADIQYRWMRNGIADSLTNNATNSFVTIHSIQSATTFTVLAERNGCITQQQSTIQVYAKPEILTPPNPTICNNDFAQISIPLAAGESIQWYPATGLSATNTATVVAFPTDTTTYSIKVTSILGCTNSTALTVNVKPRTEFTLSISSVKGEMGKDTFLIIKAHANRDVVSDVAYQIHCNADVFENTDSTTYSFEKLERIMHVHLAKVRLSTTPTEIARLRGRILLSSEKESTIEIKNPLVDSELCPTPRTTPGILQAVTCVQPLRQIAIAYFLKAQLLPNPISNAPTLTIISDELHTHTVEIYNAQSKLVHSTELAHTQRESTHTLNCTALANGSYIMIVRTATQQTTLHFVKE